MASYIFLLPPSEGKNAWWTLWKETISFSFLKPKKIADNATEKDLKCTWNRYQEWIALNKNIDKSTTEIQESIYRYSWVMYNAIDYAGMNQTWKDFFGNNFLILSGMYGIVKPLDAIGNYKLPIETKWLYDFWWTQILDTIDNLNPDYVVNLLPISYGKLIFWKNKSQQTIFNDKRKFTVININFLKLDGSKLSHWVKKIKGQWIHDVCNKKISEYRDFWGQVIQQDDDIIDVNIIH